MKTFHCNRCDNLVFFENIACERCQATLGFIPAISQLAAFEGDDAAGWRSLHPDAHGVMFRRCHNYQVEAVCNWMVPADDPGTLCEACKLTHTIPNLDAPENRLYWYRLESAKRRLLYTLLSLGLPVISRDDDPVSGLQFDFLANTGPHDPAMTGHDNGRITINIAEADDAYRERTRTEMGESYRTLLGHFRHEVGHFYFNRLVAGTRRIEPFRKLFGDERADYAAALQRHYDHGAPPDWQASFVSAYATMHPWEDWAETWAHYLHMVDTLDTAQSCGLVLKPESPREPTLTDRTPVEDASFRSLMQRWFPLTYVLNSLNRSLGVPDGYPFTLSPAVVAKLEFVHRVIDAAAREHASPAPQPAGEPAAKPAGAPAANPDIKPSR
ncbi:putative zinc-binding metallopeptidase [Cupriavidus sp. CER94]|uniref:zinc-binding metallopeptidase family protein n=1 Tax=Cupriavidus sp. CER94 TaxID=3377036 RepID=UPI00381E2E9B